MAGGDTYTITFSGITEKLTIASTGTFSILFSSGTNTASNIYSLLGFSAAEQASDSSTAASHTTANLPQVALPYTFQISIDDVGKRTLLSTNQGSLFTTFVIPVNVDSGGIVQYRLGAEFPQYIRSTHSGHYNIRLLKDGIFKSWQGAEWSFLLGVKDCPEKNVVEQMDGKSNLDRQDSRRDFLRR